MNIFHQSICVLFFDNFDFYIRFLNNNSIMLVQVTIIFYLLLWFLVDYSRQFARVIVLKSWSNFFRFWIFSIQLLYRNRMWKARPLSLSGLVCAYLCRNNRTINNGNIKPLKSSYFYETFRFYTHTKMNNRQFAFSITLFIHLMSEKSFICFLA